MSFGRPSLGSDWFDWVPTTPGRIDPSSGELVESTGVPDRESKDWFDWVEVSAGRVDPRTGKLVVPHTLPKEQRERLKKGSLGPSRDEGRSFDRFSAPGRTPFDRPSRAPGFSDRMSPSINGPVRNMGCGPCGELSGASSDGGPGAVLWLFLGVSAVIGLEALGITGWSKKA